MYHLQLTTFITRECTTELVINVFSFAFICIIFLVKYNAFLFKIQNMRFLLEQLQQICNELKSEKEIAIIKNYACGVERYTVILLGKKFVTAFYCRMKNPLKIYIIEYFASSPLSDQLYYVFIKI
ncbi:uncharacterized protein LOC112589798 [Harpegnathos saltator]|uniref:uncharacterized protein LOC112589798 n=1 Tax=Harpegnathos saltator TaxID=610380 RepID=UPI000DBED487|nr:uncharacterized protein LOC112589798 [Harpegnathos saltator]